MGYCTPNEPDEPNFDLKLRVAFTVILSFFVAATFAGNVILMTAIVTCDRLRHRTNVFVFFRAVADVGVSMTAMPMAVYRVYHNNQWHLGETGCLVYQSFQMMFITASINNLACLAVDRYFVICHPFYHSQTRTRYVAALELVCWFFPVCYFLPIMKQWHQIGLKEVLPCFPIKNFCVFLVNVPFAVFTTVVSFYLPSLVMIVCHWKIHISTTVRVAMTRRFSTLSSDFMEVKAAKTLNVVMTCFAVCWTSFYVMYVINTIMRFSIPYSALAAMFWVGLLNSMLTPCLYYYFSKKFRISIRRLFFFQSRDCDS